MDLCFLGTSAGTPTRTRNVSALAVTESQGKNWYLVDCGEGTQHQLLRTRLSLNALKGLFITHVHGDHCYGLPGILSSASMNGRTEPLTIVAPNGIKEWCEALCRYTHLYLTYELHFIAVEQLTSLALGSMHICATPLSHVLPSYAFRFSELHSRNQLNTEKLIAAGVPRGPLWGDIQAGKAITHQGQLLNSSDFIMPATPLGSAVICGDNDTPQLLTDLCQNTDILVHEATFTKDLATKASQFGHSYAAQVAQFAQRQQIPNLVLTHFSPRYQNSPKAPVSIKHIESEARAHYNGNLILARDLQRYHLNNAAELQSVDVQ